ncbi:MAG: hypothetical protein NTU47_08235 [Ignavibacteriales bacterium]|nr:hypothetical protein [Ignavibacteriales bacterium]
MAAAFIFILHFFALAFAFFSRKKSGGLSEGLLAVAFVGIVFAVGWTIATMLTNLLFTPEFFIKWYYHQTDSLFLRILRKEISRDTISLLILTFGEIGFYYLFLKGVHEEKNQDRPEDEKGTDG